MAIRIYARRTDDPPHRTFHVKVHKLDDMVIIPTRDIGAEIFSLRLVADDQVSERAEIRSTNNLGIHMKGPEGFIHIFLSRREAQALAAKLLRETSI